MAFFPREKSRRFVACILLAVALFHLLMTLLQTKNLDYGASHTTHVKVSRSLDPQKDPITLVNDIFIRSSLRSEPLESDDTKFSAKNFNPSSDSDTTPVPIQTDSTLKLNVNELKNQLERARLNTQKSSTSTSGTEIKTADLPYELFLQAPGFWKILNPKKVIKNLPTKYQNIRFLKTKPSMEEMVGAIEARSEFADPKKLNCGEAFCNVNGRTFKKEIVIENSKEMFEFLPPEEEFLKEFKNPCWKGKDDLGRENLFCLPFFFIIGFTKSGTTDLFAILKSHHFISSRASKETHFFDRRRRGRSNRMHRPAGMFLQPRSFTYYANRGTYRDDLMKTYKEVEGTEVLFHGITMDATPSYVWDNEFWESFHPGLSEPPVTNADTLAYLNPKTKIIFSLRDPISRMRSAYQFFCKYRGIYRCDRPITPQKYHNLVVEAVEKFNSCLLNNTVRGCTYSTETHQLATHLYASIYHVYIADFMKVFPRNQLYVLQMEEHIKDPITSANNICDFLGIPKFPENRLRGFLGRHKTRNQLKDDERIPYVMPETTEILEQFFKPYFKELANLLGDEKWYWKRPH